MRYYKVKALSRFLIYLVLSLGAITTLLPFLWMISTSLKDPTEVMLMPPRFLPGIWRFDNYARAMQAAPLAKYFLNTVLVTVISTTAMLFVTILASFGFSRLKFPGRDIIFGILLATLMIPGEMLIITNFVTISRLGWMDTRAALIVPFMASVFYIYLLRQFFLKIPDTLYYAAKVDACSDWRYLWKVMVPINRQAVSTIAILNAIASWNAFLWPLMVTNSESKRVLSIGLVQFQTEAGTDYELLMAAASMLVLPIIIMYLFLHKQIINGVTQSGIKG
ncbi:MAG TPA: carbohydrate ABC transporter permease [Candidatus Limiplasma sp.]|nr:carbohydrate ABC transporter permease [Candidatus Limiplasma sp.]HRX08367.1 carbohydrate ABC transporter permease [Candidatus Limiplasma sp.]